MLQFTKAQTGIEKRTYFTWESLLCARSTGFTTIKYINGSKGLVDTSTLTVIVLSLILRTETLRTPPADSPSFSCSRIPLFQTNTSRVSSLKVRNHGFVETYGVLALEVWLVLMVFCSALFLLNGCTYIYVRPAAAAIVTSRISACANSNPNCDRSWRLVFKRGLSLLPTSLADWTSSQCVHVVRNAVPSFFLLHQSGEELEVSKIKVITCESHRSYTYGTIDLVL